MHQVEVEVALASFVKMLFELNTKHSAHGPELFKESSNIPQATNFA
jgi:hypothetical protein